MDVHGEKKEEEKKNFHHGSTDARNERFDFAHSLSPRFRGLRRQLGHALPSKPSKTSRSLLPCFRGENLSSSFGLGADGR
jgi:hypothetical protein